MTKTDLLAVYRSEIALTGKVLRAIPEGQLDYRPHPKSSAIRDLIRTFIATMMMNMDFAAGKQPENTMSHVPEFDFIAEAVGTFETKSQEFLGLMENVSEDDLSLPLSVWGMDSTRSAMIMMMLHDMIHHRGQLSVYIRLAGGMVPSIYGPSADDKGGF